MNNTKKDTVINKAIEVIKGGGVVIFPTDTAFGIGCRIDNIEAIKRLYTIKKRPSGQAVPVLVDSITMAEKYLSPLSTVVRRLMKKYWSGPLTIVTKCNLNITPSLILSEGDKLGVRMPNHSTALAIINGVKVPILGPSANFHGFPTPYKFSELDSNLLKLVDYVVPGECPIANVSTVIDCSNQPFHIIRSGACEVNKNYLL